MLVIINPHDLITILGKMWEAGDQVILNVLSIIPRK